MLIIIYIRDQPCRPAGIDPVSDVDTLIVQSRTLACLTPDLTVDRDILLLVVNKSDVINERDLHRDTRRDILFAYLTESYAHAGVSGRYDLKCIRDQYKGSDNDQSCDDQLLCNLVFHFLYPP